jgi:hypothetical protein
LVLGEDAGVRMSVGRRQTGRHTCGEERRTAASQTLGSRRKR